MVQGQIDSPVNNGAIDCYKLVVGRAVIQKEGYCIIAFFYSDTVRSAVFGGDCGSDLSERDFAEDNGVSSLGISQRFDPSGASFWTVTFNYSTGVQIIMAHFLGLRCSRMISLSGFPPTRAREASTSSKRTCLSTYLCSRWLGSTNNPAARRTRRTVSRALSGAGISTDRRSMSHSCATTWGGLPRRFASSWSRWYASGGSSNVSVAIILPPGKIRFVACLRHLLCFLVRRTWLLSLFDFVKECSEW